MDFDVVEFSFAVGRSKSYKVTNSQALHTFKQVTYHNYTRFPSNYFIVPKTVAIF